MEQLIKYFIQRKLLVYLLSILVVGAGLLAATDLRRQVLPDVDMLMIQITTFYPAASARDVELNVTLPLEEKILEVDGIKRCRSVSMENFSQINITLDPDMNHVEKVKANIRRAVDQVTDLPEEVTERPSIAEWESSWIPIGILGFHCEDLSEQALRDLIKRLEKEIETLPGVAHVDKLGVRDPEIKIHVSLDKLNTNYLSLQDVSHAIKARNIRLTGGTVESFSDETSVLTLAEFTAPQEIEDVIIRSNFMGKKIRIRDIATVTETFKDRHLAYRVNGLAGMGLRIHKKKSADAITVMEKVDRYLNDNQPSLPKNLIIQKVRDSTEPTKRRLGILMNNAVIGFILLVAILVMFLNLRVAFWTAMGIPISLGVGIMAHAITGGSNDSISIMVFILVLGMLVDDAIVVAENIHRHQENGLAPIPAALTGVKEVAAPILATISTTILAFLPLFSLGGMLGLFIKMIPVIITGTLLGSLIESFFFLPSHLAHHAQSKTWRNRGAIADPLFKPLRTQYGRVLEKALHHKWLVITISMLFLAAVGYLASNHMKFVLFPSEAAEDAFATIETKTGRSFSATLETVKQIEALINSLPDDEIQNYESFVGSAESPDGSERFADNVAMIYLKLTPFGEKRNRQAAVILDELRKKAQRLEGIKTFNLQIDSGGPPVGRPVELNIVGNNVTYQSSLLKEVMTFLQTMPGVLDPTANFNYARDEEVVTIDHNKLATLGLTVADVAATIRMAYEGDIVSHVRFIQEEIDLRVQLNQADRQSRSTLDHLLVRNQSGKLIKLNQVITTQRRPALQGIYHYAGQRVVTISADVDNKLITSQDVTTRVMEKFSAINHRYPGMRIVVSGEAEESAEVMGNIAKAGILAIVAIYFILILLLDSFIQPLIILIAIPFGVIGVILAFWLHGMAIGFMAILGMLGMAGVVVNDSLIILSFIRLRAKERGEESLTSYATIVEATTTRLRPVILTTMTTSAALLPTAYGIGGADHFVQPMVMAMLWGIVFATTLTLIWVPTLFAIGQDSRKLIATIFARFKSQRSIDQV